MALKPGAAVHLIAVNGIRKFSMLRILVRLVKPMAGTLKVKGQIGLLDGKTMLDSNLSAPRSLTFWRRLDNAPPAMMSLH
ncbi:hypothetical protein [Novosphingobium sp. 9]|uniref:hypothetical protein n=1 Tax=Novosphingobium sp. 9 TaxID=2025349 RepID=UPI0021B6E1AF|nr:hypothetical protein [Novosphingobium sp. 9]